MSLFSAKFDIITIGGSTEDISFYIDDYYLIENQASAAGNELLAFDYGTKVGVAKADSTFGGGAANTAVCLAQLGLKTAGIITYGSDERGREILANLKKRGVDTSLTKMIRGQKSGFSFIVIGLNNEHVAFSYRAANSALEITNRDLAKLKQAKWTFITSLTGEWRKNLAKIFSLGSDIRIGWNPGEMQVDAGFKALKKYFKHTEVLTMNKDEAVKLVVSHPSYSKKPYGFLANSVNLLEVIKSWGPKVVVITNGDKGANSYDGHDFYHQPIIEATHKEDTTGLGDAFGSSFVAGLEFFAYDIKKALYLGALNSSAVITKLGAQNGLLARKDIEFLFKADADKLNK